MAATRVQVSAGASIASGTTLADSWPGATTAGNLLLAVIGFNNWPSSPTFAAHADWGDPIYYVQIGAGGGVRPGIAVYAITDAASRSGSESFDPSGDSDCTLHLIEISTDHATLPLILVSDDTDENASGSPTASSGTSVPSTLVEYALAIINSRPTSADQSSPTNSFTAVAELESRDNSEGVHTGIYELFPDTTGSFETSVTLDGTTYWIGVILGFAATEPPAPPPIEFVAGVSSNEANPTTSFTITIPATVEEGDLLDLTFVHRGTGDGTVSDNDSGTWTRKGEALFASSAFTIQHYYRFATAATAGKTITVNSLTNASAPALVVYRANEGQFPADPYEAWSAEANASGNETHAELTTLTPNAMVCLVVGNSPDLGVSAQSTTSPGVLAERVEKLSTGGTDASIAHASELKETAGATGSLTWTQTNAASGSIAYVIAVDAGTPVSSSVATPVEALGGVSRTTSTPTEALTPLAKTAAAHVDALAALAGSITGWYEALLAAGSSGAVPFDAAGTVTSPAIVPAEALAPAAAAAASVWEALVAVTQAQAASLEALASAAGVTEAPLDAAGTVTSPAVVPVEAIAPVAATAADVWEALVAVTQAQQQTLEALTGVAGSGDSPWDAAGVVSSANPMPVEALRLLTAPTVAVYEALLAGSGLAAVPAEALAAIARLDVTAVEAQQLLSSLQPTAWETLVAASAAAAAPWESAVEITRAVAVSLEAIAAVASITASVWESTGGLSVSAPILLPFETLAAVTGPFSGPYETLVQLGRAAANPVEAVAALAAAAPLPWESAQAVLVETPVVLPVDTLAGAAAAAAVPFEAAGAVAAALAGVWESQAPAGSATLVAWESGGGVQLAVIVPFESISLAIIFGTAEITDVQDAFAELAAAAAPAAAVVEAGASAEADGTDGVSAEIEPGPDVSATVEDKEP